jgi:transposase-like protein
MPYGSISGFHSVEDMLAARGVIVSHQTVRLWAEKFGRHFAGEFRRRSAGRLGEKWYLDEGVPRGTHSSVGAELHGR